MKSKVSLRKGRIKPAGTPLTEEKFQFYFESLKDMIRSTVRVSETMIRKDISVIQRDVSMLQVAVTEHTHMIKGLDVKIDNVRTELKEDMLQMEGRLSDKIDGHSARLDNHEIRISAIEQG